jgi:GntR family transcriptional regulator
MSRAREAILHSILDKRFEDSRLPPENDLAIMLGVSRTTVRAALQSLEQHGVVTRSPRRGTHVYVGMKPSMVALQRLIGFARLLEEQDYYVEVIAKVTQTPPPLEAVDILATRDEAFFYKFDSVIKADDRPAIWAISYFPGTGFSEPPSLDQLGQSPFEMGDILIGGPIDHAHVDLIPRNASEEVVRRLELEPAQAYLLLRETHFSASRIPLGFSLIHVNDRFVRFNLRRDGNGL